VKEIEEFRKRRAARFAGEHHGFNYAPFEFVQVQANW
jgi:hypothetical protein